MLLDCDNLSASFAELVYVVLAHTSISDSLVFGEIQVSWVSPPDDFAQKVVLPVAASRQHLRDGRVQILFMSVAHGPARIAIEAACVLLKLASAQSIKIKSCLVSSTRAMRN